MNQLVDSCANGVNYPANLVCSSFHQYELQAYAEALTRSEKSLCYTHRENQANDWGIHLWQRLSHQDRYSETVINNAEALVRHLKVNDPARSQDPISRFAFLHARNARERLNVIPPTLRHLLSHHQVNAAVVDQLRSFGRRKYEQDFSACGFRAEACLSVKSPGLVVPELGRSGRQLELCYTLRTIEDPQRWTMRQTSTYHSFDVVTGHAFWLIIKADATIRTRIQGTSEGRKSPNSSHDNRAALLESTFASHLIMCKWANENWRPYVGKLEADVQELTKKTIALDTRQLPRVTIGTNTMNGNLPRNSAFGPITRASTLQRVGTFINRPFSRRGAAQKPDQAANDITLDTLDDSDEEEELTIDDMQSKQTLEEKIHLALLVARTNSDTLSQLRRFYSTINQIEGWPHDLGRTSTTDIAQFAAAINNIEFDLKLQQARLETLVRLLADRKALLYAIIENRNAESNQALALEAQKSRKHMEKMTDWMSNLAEKTQQETVTMRIITLVTLFFLPGTFICTLMSTDIIRYEWADLDDTFERHFSSGALKMFLTITVPLMFVTFFASFMVYSWTRRKQIREKSKQLHDRFKEKV